MQYFGSFRWDVAQQTLWRGATRLRLTNKALALFGLLLSQAGRPVSKDAILATVWPGTHVLPDNIKVLIREIRRALGEQSSGSSDPRFIRCEPNRGYAFVAPLLDDGARVAGPSTGTRWRPHDGLPAAATCTGPSSGPPFVNRGPELASLADAFDAAVAGQRRFVLLRGERGIGKSALATAGLRMARAVAPLRAGYGQCVPTARPSESYAPIIDALHRLCRQYPAAIPEVLAHHAPDWLAQLPEWAPGQPLTARPADRQTLLTQLNRAVSYLAMEMPLVMVLEDLEWADDDTRVALSYLASRPAPAKLLVIGTGNAFVTMGRRWPHAFSGSADVSLIDVTPLAKGHVQRYLDMRFGPGALSELAPLVHTASSGNPSLMVAGVDALVAEGLVVQIGGRWQVHATATHIRSLIHEATSAPLARNLAALDDESASVLQTAATTGVEFDVSSVASRIGRSRRWVRERIWALAQQGLVTPVEDRPTLVRIERFRLCVPAHAELLHRDAVTRRARTIIPQPGYDRAHARIA